MAKKISTSSLNPNLGVLIKKKKCVPRLRAARK